MRNRNRNFATAAKNIEKCLNFGNIFLKTKIKVKFPSQINGKKYKRKTVKGPKITPLAKTPKLGKTTIGNRNFFGKKAAAKNKQAFTMVPTIHWGWPKEKGTKKDKIERATKNKTAVNLDKLKGKLNDKNSCCI